MLGPAVREAPLLLIAERIVEACRSHSGVVGEVAHRCRLIAAFPEKSRRGFDRRVFIEFPRARPSRSVGRYRE
jgi:hypothetical protein